MKQTNKQKNKHLAYTKVDAYFILFFIIIFLNQII